MGTNIDIYYMGGQWVTPLPASGIEIRRWRSASRWARSPRDMVRSVRQQNGAAKVVGMHNGLPTTRRHR
jgi:hypothetical protein